MGHSGGVVFGIGVVLGAAALQESREVLGFKMVTILTSRLGAVVAKTHGDSPAGIAARAWRFSSP